MRTSQLHEDPYLYDNRAVATGLVIAGVLAYSLHLGAWRKAAAKAEGILCERKKVRLEM